MSDSVLQAELAVAKAQLALAQAQEAARAQVAAAVDASSTQKAESGKAAIDQQDCASTQVREDGIKHATSTDIIEEAPKRVDGDTHAEVWTKLLEEPFTLDARESAVHGIDSTTTDAEVDTQPDNDDLRVARELAEASEDENVAEVGDKRASERASKTRRSSARTRRVATRAILAEEDDAETLGSVTPASKRKRSEIEELSSSGEEMENDDTLGAEEVLAVALNKGAAPKGPAFEFADCVMRFAAFAFSYASLWGKDHQEAVFSMIKPLVQLELAHWFELGHEMPGLPSSAISWVSQRRAACKIDDPSYVRNALKEAHLEHKMLSCMSTLRSLKFADVALMHGRRGYILLVR
ncbi:unnamed protein product, partial [Peniophora sp. CBMAI 1063]